jgi:hypothetical protein
MALRRAAPLALTCALAGLLAGCGQQAATAPTAAPPSTAPTAAPTAAPTMPPAPTEAPTAAATATPVPEAAPTAAPGAAVLPRPLYTLLAGQIYRIEADGVARTQITYEVPFRNDVLAVTEFAVSPADSTLVYVVQRAGPSALVRSGPSGEDPAPLFDSDTVLPSQPLFTPDGQSVAVRLTGAEGNPEFQNGVYLIPVAGGEPQLLVPDEAAPADQSQAFGHQPLAFSPDGARLLTNRYSLTVEQCDLGVVTVADGKAIAIQAPPAPEGERATTCDGGAWAPDGSAIYFTSSVIGAPAGAPAIWKASPESGESFPITPQPGQAPFTLYTAPAVAPDGSLLAFTAQADALPRGFEEQQPTLAYSMARVNAADGTLAELRPAVAEMPQLVQWDPAGRGAVALLFPEVGDPGLFWLPADGGEATLLLGATTDLSAYRWAAR